MLNRTARAESLYHQVAAFIGRSDCALERHVIDQTFPKVEPKRITKALENAAQRGLIHSVGRGQYRSGPKPDPSWNMSDPWLSQAELDAMAQAILPAALSNRTPIETAWFRVARTGRTSAISA